jgi:hypothetical protein
MPNQNSIIPVPDESDVLVATIPQNQPNITQPINQTTPQAPPKWEETTPVTVTSPRWDETAPITQTTPRWEETASIAQEPSQLEQQALASAKSAETPLETDPAKLLGNNLIGDIQRTAISTTAGLVSMGLSTLRGAADLSAQIEPAFITKAKEELGIAKFEKSAKTQVESWLTNLGAIQSSMNEEIKRQGGVGAEVAQDIGNMALDTAANLAVLNASSFFGKGATFAQSLADAAKMAALAYVQTPGTQAEKFKAAAVMGAYALSPIPAGKLPKDWQAKIANIAENVVINTISGNYGGDTAWTKKIPQAVLDTLFGVMAKGRGSKDPNAVIPEADKQKIMAAMAKVGADAIKTPEVNLPPITAEELAAKPPETGLPPLKQAEIPAVLPMEPMEPIAPDVTPLVPSPAPITEQSAISAGLRPTEKPEAGGRALPSEVKPTEPILPPPTPPSQTKPVQAEKPLPTTGAGEGALPLQEPTRADFNTQFDAIKKTINPDTGKNYTEPEIYTALGDRHFKEGDVEANRELIGKLESLGAATARKIEKGPAITPTMPVSQVAVQGKLISTKDVVMQIEESFGLPIRIGRFREKAAGIYKQQAEVARTKTFGDITTTTHEAAHHLDNTTGLIENLPVDLKTELAGLDYEPTKQRPGEGFAEYLRLRLTTDGQAQAKAPNFDTWFEYGWLPTHPEWKTNIDKVKGIITQFRQEGSVNRVMAQINKESDRFKTVKEWLTEPRKIFESIYDAMYNRQQPLWRAQFEMAKTIKLSDIPGEYRFAQAAKVLNMAAPSKVRQMVETGMTDVAGQKIGSSLKEALDPINESIQTKENQQEFEALLYSLHSLDVISAGKEPGISRSDAQFTVAELSRRPGWLEAAKGVTKWHDGLLDYLIDAGGLTAEGKAKMKQLYPNYIPLFRYMEGTPPGGGGGGKQLADIGQPIKHLKGSGRQIISPLENSMIQAERIVAMADKIRVMRMMADASEHYQGAGEIIEKVSPGMKTTSASIDVLKNQLEKAGLDTSGADMDSVLTIYENIYKGSNKDNVVVLWRNGKQEMYQVRPDIYRVVTAMDQQFQLPRVLDWIFGKPARMIRLTTTGLRAGFSMITNPLRDTMTSVMQTRTKGYSGSLPGKISENIAGIYHDILGTEMARLFKAGGGEMAQPLAIDRVFRQEMLQELLAKTTKQKALNWSKHPIDSLRQLFSITELGPRLAEFERILKQSGWREGQKITFEQYLDAQMAAADVTVDFRQGGWLSMWLNRVTPFHNANMQGPVQMVQAFKRAPAESMAKGMLYFTLPTLALWWANKDKDWYKNMPDFEKYGYWHIPIGKTIIRVPRPFEWGVLFASIPEAMAQMAYEQDAKRFTDMAAQAFQIMMPPIVPSAVSIPSETIFNYDTFRRRPIVSRGMEYLKPEDRFSMTTTESAKEMGKLFGVSPAKIEFLMSSFTGGLSTETLQATENAIRMILGTEKGARPQELSDLPIIGRLFLRPGVTRIFDDFYSQAEKLNQSHASAEAHGISLPFSEMQQRYIFNASIEQLQFFRKESREIIDNAQMPDELKRTELQRIQNEMIKLAENALGQYKGNQ